jgi:hypothetical protein
LITSTAGSLLLRRLLEAEPPPEVVVVEREVNQSPMERNRDLKDDDEEEEEVERSENGRDQAGLDAQLRCSGVRRPEDDGARDPRRSRPAMLGSESRRAPSLLCRPAGIGRRGRSRGPRLAAACWLLLLSC